MTKSNNGLMSKINFKYCSVISRSHFVRSISQNTVAVDAIILSIATRAESNVIATSAEYTLSIHTLFIQHSPNNGANNNFWQR